MGITIENLPIIFLLIVGLGMVIVLVGIIRLANHNEDASAYTSLEDNEHTSHLEDLFSFFLQEEEKKNQSFREMVMDVSKQKVHKTITPSTEESVEGFHAKNEKRAIKSDEATLPTHEEQSKPRTANKGQDKEIFTEIMKRYEAGQDVETIAKELKKGTGEVKLIISLYSMR